MKHVFRFAVLFALILAIAVALGPASVATSAPAVNVKLTEIGHPLWHPVDFHMFSAPIGFGPFYPDFTNTSAAILPPPNHVLGSELFIAPGAAHLPPYTNEMAQGLANLKYDQGTRFNAAQFSNGNGVWLIWMTVPKPGVTGSSPDFDSGPIIPNSAFPMLVTGVALRNGEMFDPYYLPDISIPALNALSHPFNVDGASHYPMFTADNMDFGPAGTNAPGNYEYQIKVTDAQGNGWSMVADFTITAK